MNDPLVTRERRLKQIENLACCLNEIKLLGVRFPAADTKALLSIIKDERAYCHSTREWRKEHGLP